jgi:cytochrome bd-type quinol oxidase subunit 2
MANMLKRIVLSAVVVIGLTAGAFVALEPQSVLAAPKDEVCAGISAVNGSCAADGTLTNVIRKILNIFSIIVGVVAVFMIMVGGFKYITASGDSGNISSAKTTIIYAIIGLVIAALSQTIVQFVLSNVK